jgi:uracil-DNA glycosylase family protein
VLSKRSVKATPEPERSSNRRSPVRASEPKDAAAFVPAQRSLPILRNAVQSCRGCDLYRSATQAVAGEGPPSSLAVFIGEQPGDEEDRQGRPFVGPAGRLLDRALQEAGIDRSLVYVTNSVKHFKFEERGKRRIHKKPRARESLACRPWLEAELEAIRPKIIVCLGATAAQAVFGSGYRVTKERGTLVKHVWAPFATSTIHPSAILRAPDDQREVEYRQLVEDLKIVQAAMGADGPSSG